MGESRLFLMAPKIGFGKAVISDSRGISSLSGSPVVEICPSIRDYFVSRLDGLVVGTVKLQILNCDIAEASCLFVQSNQKGKGIGSRLVELVLYDAKLTGLKKVILFTEIPGFFSKFRFMEANPGDYGLKGKGTFMVASLDHLD